MSSESLCSVSSRSSEEYDYSDRAIALVRLGSIEAISAQHERILRSTKPPFEKQDDQFKRYKTKIEDMTAEFDRVISGGDLPKSARPYDTRVAWSLRCAVEIQELQKLVEMGPDRKSVEEDEAKYQARCREQEKQFFSSVLGIFGDDGCGWAMEYYRQNNYTTATDMATPQSMTSNTSTPSPENDRGDDRPGGDEWDVPEDVEDPTPLTPPPNTHLAKRAPARKRRIASTASPRQRKRPRHNNTQGFLTGDRTIEFDQVFQDGNAPTKYKIARYHGAWYILECRKHYKHFRKNPILGAAKHLDSADHGHMGRDHEEAIRKLGTRVLGCNEKLAAKNNAVADRAFAEDAEKPGGNKRSRRRASKSCFKIPQPRNINKIMSLINPGDVCVTHWQDHKGLYPIYILPLGVSERLGFRKSAILETDLIKQLPACYEFNPDTDKIPRWAPGYEDGGEKVHKRLYPVMFFKGWRFPQGNEISFVPASHMRPYDKNDLRIRYRDQVEDFLTRRDRPTASPSADSRRSSPSEFSPVEMGFKASPLTTGAAADSDRQDTPCSDDAIPERATPRQRLSPYPDIQRFLEQASADFGEPAIVEEEHEIDEHGDHPSNPHTSVTGDKEETGEKEVVGKSMHYFHYRRQRHDFYDGDTEESAAESEKEEDKVRVNEDEDDIYEDDTLGKPSIHRSQSSTIPQRAFNTPATSTSDAPNPTFPQFNEFWRRQSRERTIESDKQSSYSELLHVGLQMGQNGSAGSSG
ncbi:hypothetical protein CEP52_005220 [Fusarium oligoseptatum]|uniref:Uncharacterized protein n=1 Tax=Fusarium oligoseptatum TaxID=2604345 RepID=A0A428TZF3_9HYPO|nr:hypothetical protein CEP52_005220 [Fusarium oligoseptatum]